MISTGIKKIRIEFDLDPLEKKLKSSPDNFLFTKELKAELYPSIAEAAKKKINDGRAGRKLKPSTIEIRQKRGNPPGPQLKETGNLVKNLIGKKDGLYANAQNKKEEYYSHYHLEGYTVQKDEKNKFTRRWKKNHKVPRRNFLPMKEKLILTDKAKSILIKQINNLIVKKGG